MLKKFHIDISHGRLQLMYRCKSTEYSVALAALMLNRAPGYNRPNYSSNRDYRRSGRVISRNLLRLVVLLYTSSRRQMCGQMQVANVVLQLFFLNSVRLSDRYIRAT